MDGHATTDDPIALFEAWMAEAGKSEPNDANAVCLATASPEGVPSARMVLLKGVDARGFVFYTNLESRKGREGKMASILIAISPKISFPKASFTGIAGPWSRSARDRRLL